MPQMGDCARTLAPGYFLCRQEAAVKIAAPLMKYPKLHRTLGPLIVRMEGRRTCGEPTGQQGRVLSPSLYDAIVRAAGFMSRIRFAAP
jgi:hypothetical protein